MTRDEISKWLTNLKNDIGETQYQPLWHYAEAIDMAIEALECKRGEWIILYDEDSPQDGIWKCSACDYIRLMDDITPMNYCPNCGADMRERKEDEHL